MATEFQRIFGEPVDFHALVSYLVYCLMHIEPLFFFHVPQLLELMSACRSERYPLRPKKSHLNLHHDRKEQNMSHVS
jgi:hypothetical protein